MKKIFVLFLTVLLLINVAGCEMNQKKEPEEDKTKIVGYETLFEAIGVKREDVVSVQRDKSLEEINKNEFLDDILQFPVIRYVPKVPYHIVGGANQRVYIITFKDNSTKNISLEYLNIGSEEGTFFVLSVHGKKLDEVCSKYNR